MRNSPLKFRRVGLSVLCVLLFSSLSAGQVETNKSVTIRAWGVPSNASGVKNLSTMRIVEAFKDRYPYVALEPSTGLTIPGRAMDYTPLMQIAGEIPPDAMYVNFRQSDTYIRNKFLYPLDKYIERMLGKDIAYGLDIKDGPMLPTGTYPPEEGADDYDRSKQRTYLGELRTPLSESDWRAYRTGWEKNHAMSLPMMKFLVTEMKRNGQMDVYDVTTLAGPLREALAVKFPQADLNELAFKALLRKTEVYRNRFAGGYEGYLAWNERAFQIEILDRIPYQCWAVMRRESPYGGPDSDYPHPHAEEWGFDASQPHEHVWAYPQGPLVMALFYRKDLFHEAGLPNRVPETIEELYTWSKKLTNPKEERYGLEIRTQELSWSTLSFLYSYGGLIVDKIDGQWRCVFDTPEAVDAYFFVATLFLEPFVDTAGNDVNSVVYTGEGAGGLVQNAMFFAYLDPRFFDERDPTMYGFGPVPKGPTGERGSEFNSRMMGIYAGLGAPENKALRDATWEYLRFYDGRRARIIYARTFVENGLARYVMPASLKAAGLDEYIRDVPEAWVENYKQALKNGVPEPYGKNCQMVYTYASQSIDQIRTDTRIRRLIEERKAILERIEPLQGELNTLQESPTPDPDKREELRQQIASLTEQADKLEAQVKDIISDILTQRVKKSNQKMLDIISPEERRTHTIVAVIVTISILVLFVVMFWWVFRAFEKAQVRDPNAPKGRWQLVRYRWAYLIMIPAVGSLLLWMYYPLLRGTLMAFQDYNVRGFSEFVGMKNFAFVLFDDEFWHSLYVSLKYAVLFMFFGFTSPIALAFLLTEVPRGKLAFRVIYYMPAILTGVITIFLWKSFYGQYGMINEVLNYMILAVNGLLANPVTGTLLRVVIGGLVGGIGWLLISSFVKIETESTLRLLPLVLVLIPALLQLFFSAGLAVLWLIVPPLGIMLLWMLASLLIPRTRPWVPLPLLAAALFVGLQIAATGYAGVDRGNETQTAIAAADRLAAMIRWGSYLLPLIPLLGAVVAARKRADEQQVLASVPVGLVGLGLLGFLPVLFQAWIPLEPLRINWLNNPNTALISIIIPIVWAGMGPGCLIYLAALKTVPEEIYEAADIDGAGILHKAFYVAIPNIKGLIMINFIGMMVAQIKGGATYALAMTGGGPYTPYGQTEFIGLHIFYQAFGYLNFGRATAMAWILASMLIGFTVIQLQRISRMEFRTASGVAGKEEGAK
jgi:ABC-type sugar transport system permease subunit